MKNKVVLSLIALGAVAVGGISSAQAIEYSNQPQVQNQRLLVTQTKSTTTLSTNTNNSNATNSNTTKKSKTHHRDDFSRGLIVKDLKAGQTVSQIKATIEANFKTKIDKLVTQKKITQAEANTKITNFNNHLAKANILKGIVKSKTAMDALNSGQTLSQTENTLIAAMKTKINEKVTQKKITEAQANKIEARLTKEISSGHGIFTDMSLMKTIQGDLQKGESASQIESALINQREAKLQTLVKDGKLTQAQLTKIEANLTKRIDNMPIFKAIENGTYTNPRTMFKPGETSTEMISQLKSQESTINSNTKLTSTQKTNLTNKINKLIAKIQSGKFHVNQSK